VSSDPPNGLSLLPLQTSLLTLLQAAFEQAFNAVVITTATQDKEGPRIIYCNPAFCTMTGYSQQELIGKSPRILQGPLTCREIIQTLRDALHNGTFFHGSTFNYRKDGSSYLVEWNISPIRNQAGEIEAFVSVQQDITRRTEAERLKSLLASALHATEDAVMIADLQAEIIFVNEAFETQSGYSSAEILGKTPEFLQSGEQSEALYRQIRERLKRGESCQITLTNRHKEGHYYYSAQTITPLKDESGRVHHYVSVSKDVSAEVAKVEALRKLAHHDVLTGLLNRRAGEQRLRRCVSISHAEHCTYALILADIDEFKQINDIHGHDVGDEVLQRCATFLRKYVRNTDYVVRWGGEEFLIILPHCDVDKAKEIAERICHQIASTLIPTVERVTLSIGVALGHDKETYTDVLRRADQALYFAKRNGRNQVIVAD
jgi:diguanylate cyclase (GGDEF)-like protein/PAS domain S-box-containing protein